VKRRKPDLSKIPPPEEFLEETYEPEVFRVDAPSPETVIAVYNIVELLKELRMETERLREEVKRGRKAMFDVLYL